MTQPAENNNSKKDIFFKNLLSTIESNLVIPIIGYDLLNSSAKGNVSENPIIDVKDAEDPDKDLFTKLMEVYDKDLCEDVRVKYKRLNNEIKNGYELMNAVYNELSILRRDNFSNDIHKIVKSIHEHVENIPAPFELLSKIKCFRFYINATIFNNIEMAVNVYKVEGKGTDAQSSGNQMYEVINCGFNDLDEIKIASYQKSKALTSKTKFSTQFFDKPCVLNLFGTHNLSSSVYIMLESDIIEFILNLFNTQTKKFNDLKFILKDASLLFIGCDFPDWILRFFIRFCLDSRIDKEKLSKSYIFENIKNSSERSKIFFITNYGLNTANEVESIDMNPSEFVEELYNRLNKEPFKTDKIEKDHFNNHVFVSYNKEDKTVAEKIVAKLKEKFIDVWFDREDGLRVNDVIDDKIIEAIDNSCAFIPIITGNANKDIQAPRYYKKEWNYAIKNKKRNEIFPIRTTDFTNNNLYPVGGFDEDTINLLLKEGGIKYQNVNPDEIKFDDNFLPTLKNLQFLSRIKNTNGSNDGK